MKASNTCCRWRCSAAVPALNLVPTGPDQLAARARPSPAQLPHAAAPNGLPDTLVTSLPGIDSRLGGRRGSAATGPDLDAWDDHLVDGVEARSLGDLEPEPPPEYRPALADYGKALTDLASALSLWAEGAAPRIESKVLEKQLVQDGEAWSTTNNLSAADPVAWRYDAFLHCAVPELDRLKDSQALLETLATRCIARSGQPADAEFLERLHGTCLPAAKTSPAKAPPRFKATWDKLAADYDRLSQGFGVCFRRMNKTRKRPGLEELDSAWERSLGASSQIRQLLSAQLGAADKR